MIGIYKITSPSGKVYVGQTIDIDKRFNGYKNQKQNTFQNQTRLKRSMLKYGWANHIFEVIVECAIEDLNRMERHYQDEFDVIGPKGLNCLLTKVDGKPRVWAPESRKNMGKKGKAHHMYGKKHTPESLAKMSASMKGKPSNRKGAKLSDETKQRIGKSLVGLLAGEKHPMFGKKHSAETVAKMKATKAAMPDKQAYAIARAAQANIGRTPANARKVLRELDGVMYSSIVAAAKDNNFSQSTLQRKLSGVYENDTGLVYLDNNV
jgi:group I intron endonuclease